MRSEELLNFQQKLTAARNDILARIKDSQSRWQETAEPAIEMEEEAQKAAMTIPYDRIDETGKEMVRQIDFALGKISDGEYGICEHCGDDISPNRLHAVPWARLCIDCAREFERKSRSIPSPLDTTQASELPDEYQGLSNNQILALVHEQIEKDGRIDTEELEISIREEVLNLDGVIASEPEHQILMQLLMDTLGFSTVVDHLTLNEVVFERDDRMPKTKTPAEEATLESRLFYDQEELNEDLFDAGDEQAYSPPEKPTPHEEYYRTHID